MTLIIGLTGGIGSGKSTVANYFSALGVPIIDADKIAHELVKPHSFAWKKIKSHFGDSLFFENDQLNRKALREIIFQNKNEKHWLESLLHPLIREKMRKEIDDCQSPYCLCVIPLLVESKDIDFLDRILVIDAPVELRIKRTKDRDRTDEASIEDIIKYQSKREKRLAIADDIIINDTDLESLRENVKKLHERYLELSKHKEKK